MEDVIEYLSGIILPIFAALIVYLQYSLSRQQHRLEKQRLQLALFNKRHKVYTATMAYIAAVFQSGALDRQEWLKFLRKSKDHEFLFGVDVREFLEELQKNGNDLCACQEMLKGAQMGDERGQLVDSKYKLIEWFSKQFDRSKELFGKYLKVADD